MSRPRLDRSGGGGTRAQDDLDDVDVDLDDAVPARPAGPAVRPGARPSGRRRTVVAAVAGAAALTALLVTSVGRHEDSAAALESATAAAAAASAAANDPAVVAWRDQQRRSQAHDASEVAALSLLPEDLAHDQLFVRRALKGAAPRLVDLDWSTARTSTVRDGAQRTGDGGPRLVDAARFARTSTDPGGSEATGPSAGLPVGQPMRVPVTEGSLVVLPPAGAGPATGVGWRITTPLRPGGFGEPCSVAGALPLPEAAAGVEPPVCRLEEFTSASGEQQVVAVRSWERPVDEPGTAGPARVEVVHQAVLVTDDRWGWSVASTAVGRPGTAAAVPPMSLDQVVLAVRWLADGMRGLPTPAPLDGTPLPGFSE